MGCYAGRLFYLLTNQNDYNIYQRENLGKIPGGIPPVAKHLGAGLLHYKECNNYMQCRPTLIKLGLACMMNNFTGTVLYPGHLWPFPRRT